MDASAGPSSSGSPSSGPAWTGGDYVSGERVFAPPTGTLDVDWVTPALVEAVAREHGRAVDRDRARAWVVAAWAAVRETAAERGVRPGDVEPAAVLTRMAPTGPDTAALAVRVVLDAVRAFGVT